MIGGLREKGFKKTAGPGEPLVSVVTVVFNAAEIIEKTMLSIIRQTYKNIEYIIVDGASTDGTLDIIRKYEDKIDYWISEPDKGIYDAMNKGINLATGGWALFMNAGDWFYADTVIQEFIDVNPDRVKNYYGDNIYFKANISYIFTARINSRRDFLKHNTFSHQAVFYSVELLKKSGGYDTSLKVSADFDLTYRLSLVSDFIKLNHIIAVCNAEGYSTKNTMISYFDRLKSFYKNSSRFFAFLLVIGLPFFYIKQLIVSKLGGTSLYNLYRRIKYKSIGNPQQGRGFTLNIK
jgi:glycosyltransferase involved in cell wall biosynthesis